MLYIQDFSDNISGFVSLDENFIPHLKVFKSLEASVHSYPGHLLQCLELCIFIICPALAGKCIEYRLRKFIG